MKKLIDRRAAILGSNERSDESLLVAAAEQECRNAGAFQHGGKGLIDDTVTRELLGAKPRALPQDGLDQIAAGGADARHKPKRETVGGQPPRLLEIGPPSHQRVRRPDGNGAASACGPKIGLSGAHGEA